VSRLRNGRLRTFGERDGLPPANRIAEASTGVTVAGTATGLALFSNERWKDVSAEWGYPDTEGVAVWFDRGGTLWVESEARVLYLPAGSHRFADPVMPLVVQPGVRADFAEAPDGTIWVADIGDNNYLYGTQQGLILEQLLKQCGNDLSRENIVKQARNIQKLPLPTLIPGIVINTGPDNSMALTQLQLQRWTGSTWEPFGGVLSAD